MRSSMSSAAVLLLAMHCSSAFSALSVDGIFNQREVRGPSSLYGPGSDAIVAGAIDVVPNGAGGTTGSVEQFNTRTGQLFTGEMTATPFSAFPNAFNAVFVPYDPGLAGSWKMTLRNGDEVVERFSPAIGTAPPPAGPTAVKLSGAGTTPTLSWLLPAGSTASSASVTIYEKKSEAFADIIHVAPLGQLATSYSIPSMLSSGQSLRPGGHYTFSVELNDNRPDGSYRARGFTFIDFTPLASEGDVYLPETVTTPEGTVFQFAGVPVVAGVPVTIDPDVAIGYDYAIGAGDPLFRTVTLPSGIGDGKYDVSVFRLGNWQIVQSGLLEGVAFDFGESGEVAFRVTGIETGAGLDPADSTAFLTTLTFVTDGTFNGTMTPLVVEVPVPEPQTWVLMLAGLGLVARTAQRSVARWG